jgi:retinol-binding protein 3
VAPIRTIAFALAFAASAPTAESQTPTRAQVVERIASELERGYVYPEIGMSMARHARARAAAGAYDAMADDRAFVDSLTSDLRSVSRDGHLRVITRAPQPAAPSGGPPRQPPVAVEKVERLAGNVGYFKVNGFPPARFIAPMIDEAMRTLAETEALIIDLRENGGGAPDGAMYLAGYFFDKPTLVARIYSRDDDSMTEMSTGSVAGPLYLRKPLYILTAKRTFSAGEAAAYHLKHVARAITVGEPSGGGAHRIRTVDVDPRFTVVLPYTRPINVVTNGDWEGTGVLPEIPTPAEQAVTAAHLAALRKLPKTPERDAAIRQLEGK